jgi:hypothetical protein
MARLARPRTGASRHTGRFSRNPIRAAGRLAQKLPKTAPPPVPMTARSEDFDIAEAAMAMVTGGGVTLRARHRSWSLCSKCPWNWRSMMAAVETSAAIWKRTRCETATSQKRSATVLSFFWTHQRCCRGRDCTQPTRSRSGRRIVKPRFCFSYRHRTHHVSLHTASATWNACLLTVREARHLRVKAHGLRRITQSADATQPLCLALGPGFGSLRFHSSAIGLVTATIGHPSIVGVVVVRAGEVGGSPRQLTYSTTMRRSHQTDNTASSLFV